MVYREDHGHNIIHKLLKLYNSHEKKETGPRDTEHEARVKWICEIIQLVNKKQSKWWGQSRVGMLVSSKGKSTVERYFRGLTSNFEVEFTKVLLYWYKSKSISNI